MSIGHIGTYEAEVMRVEFKKLTCEELERKSKEYTDIDPHSPYYNDYLVQMMIADAIMKERLEEKIPERSRIAWCPPCFSGDLVSVRDGRCFSHYCSSCGHLNMYDSNGAWCP